MPTRKTLDTTIICADSHGDGYFSTGHSVDDAYENYCAYHGNTDIRTVTFYSAIEIPESKIPQGDYD